MAGSQHRDPGGKTSWKCKGGLQPSCLDPQTRLFLPLVQSFSPSLSREAPPGLASGSGSAQSPLLPAPSAPEMLAVPHSSYQPCCLILQGLVWGLLPPRMIFLLLSACYHPLFSQISQPGQTSFYKSTTSLFFETFAIAAVCTTQLTAASLTKAAKLPDDLVVASDPKSPQCPALSKTLLTFVGWMDGSHPLHVGQSQG